MFNCIQLNKQTWKNWYHKHYNIFPICFLGTCIFSKALMLFKFIWMSNLPPSDFLYENKHQNAEIRRTSLYLLLLLLFSSTVPRLKNEKIKKIQMIQSSLFFLGFISIFCFPRRRKMRNIVRKMRNKENVKERTDVGGAGIRGWVTIKTKCRKRAGNRMLCWDKIQGMKLALQGSLRRNAWITILQNRQDSFVKRFFFLYLHKITKSIFDTSTNFF